MGGLVWFRRDLRLGDNPAWAAATSAHDQVTALFVFDPVLMEGAGEHRRSQLVAHLRALDARLTEEGGRLLVRHGAPEAVVPETARRHEAVYWNADYTPYATRRDRAVAERLEPDLATFGGVAVHPPGAVLKADGDPYLVFTPYYRRWLETSWEPWPEPGAARVGADAGDGLPDAPEPLMAPGEDAALARLESFLDRVDRYPDTRDRPDLDETSRLSADLKFGTIAARRVAAEVGEATAARAAFVRQLGWRDFWLQMLYHFPHTARRALRPEYDWIEWRNDRAEFTAWTEGRTGYPIVDAGMRQLRAEGWMHNRVRMIVASFLVKDLLIDWRWGERWFRRMLVDGDVAQNVGNWQWVAGTGADAAPYFRIFNPVSQGEKFDPDGEYVRRYVPELEGIGAAHIHEPWQAGPLELAAAGINPGVDYPAPIVDHREARERTLAAYREAREFAAAMPEGD